MHAETSRSSPRATLEQTPDRGIERRDGIGPLNDERERAAGSFIAVLHGLVGCPLDPLLQATAVDPFEAREGVATEGGAPANRCTNVCAEHSGVNAHARIRLGGDVQAPEGGPEERARG